MLPENPTFFVRGEDGEEYGPVDLAEMREWVAEKRAGLGTEVKRDEPDGTWQPWQHFPELVALLAEVNVTEGEAIPGDVAIAPMWRRVLAFGLDLFLASLLSVPPTYVLATMAGVPDLELRYLLAALQSDQPAPPNIMFYGMLSQFVSQIFFLLYFTCFIAAHGQTPGKSILRLRVITADGQKPYFVKSLVRAIVMVVSTNLLFLPMLFAFINPQRRALHDWIAGTYVVEA